MIWGVFTLFSVLVLFWPSLGNLSPKEVGDERDTPTFHRPNGLL